MALTITREEPKPTLIRMGHAPVVLQPEAPVKETRSEPAEVKMADKKLDHGAGGPETIRKDSASDKGAIGSGGVNAPAQDKVPKGGSNKTDKGGKNG